MSSNDSPWLPYDPSWLIELAKVQYPRKKWLQRALGDCTVARTRICCAPKICGYEFVESSRANQPASEWQYETSLVLAFPDGGRDVVLDILTSRRIGGIEFF